MAGDGQHGWPRDAAGRAGASAEPSATPSSPAAAAGGAPECRAAQLKIAYTDNKQIRNGALDGMSHADHVVMFTNEGSASCQTQGYPGVAALNSAGRQIKQARPPGRPAGGDRPQAGPGRLGPSFRQHRVLHHADHGVRSPGHRSRPADVHPAGTCREALPSQPRRGGNGAGQRGRTEALARGGVSCGRAGGAVSRPLRLRLAARSRWRDCACAARVSHACRSPRILAARCPAPRLAG